MPLRSVSKTRRKEKTKKRTSKIIDRLTYVPQKHKQKFRKQLRKSLQTRDAPTIHAPSRPSTSIKFGSININGLDLESSWAVEQLISKRGFDVSSITIMFQKQTSKYDYRYLQ